MKLVIMRHAEALPGENDAERQLSRTGKEDARRMALLLAATNWQIGDLRSSSLVRACQTRDILLNQLNPRQGQPLTIASTDDRLNPGFSGELCLSILQEMEESKKNGVWIFHAPDVAYIASYLTGIGTNGLYFTPGCMMALNLPMPDPVGRALPIWQNQPEYLRSIL